MKRLYVTKLSSESNSLVFQLYAPVIYLALYPKGKSEEQTLHAVYSYALLRLHITKSKHFLLAVMVHKSVERLVGPWEKP